MPVRCAVAVAVAALAGCSHGRVVTPTGPHVGVILEPRVPILPIGHDLRIATDWAGVCAETSGFPLSLTGKSSDTREACDIRDYHLDVACIGECAIAMSGKHGGATYRTAVSLDIRGPDRDVDGVTYADVRPLGASVQVRVTLRRGDQSYVRQLPRYEVVVPTDVVVLCRGRVDGRDHQGACDREFAASDGVEITVGSPDDRPVGEVTIEGHRVEGPVMLANILVLPSAPPGDYALDLALNPAPYTIHKTVTIHVR